MRRIIPLILVALTACVPPVDDSSIGVARFASYPDDLFTALELACSSPAQTFLRLSENRVECREYLPPEPTAALILSHDGTQEDLPQLVIRFDAHADTLGWLVENDVFLNVPRRSSSALELRERDPRMTRTLNALYRRAGGVPE
ncbi:hypothetical protein [Pontibaca salina]|uniref:Lipoprotein n=1 Tax=Pontibaca salina TaxID=2795731 RepID=A0A934M2S1_9RHOB|nr:hypothetical protein [Pontibaca salina]MBI6629099.1 hypothetical protein [Pontibaca salina]